MRKSNEVPKERRQIPSPSEMSRLKYEKQLKLEEQIRLNQRLQYQQNVSLPCIAKLDYQLILSTGKEGRATERQSSY